MKCLVYLFLFLFAAIVASANTNADVSDNLLSNNFMDDWSGTNDHFHGANILAGVHDEYRQQTITLSDHLTSAEIQGITSTEFNAEVWFWNQYNQSVDLTQQIIDSNGLTYSNTITMSGDCNTFNGCGYQTSPTNTIIITNPASDYDITARFDFSVPAQNNNYHYAADVKDPNLVVNYEPFSIDLSTTNDLSLWLDDFEESFTQEFSEPDFFIMEDIFEEEQLLFNEYFIFEEPSVIFLPQEPTLLPEIEFMEEAPIFFSEEMFIEEPMTMEEVRNEIISEIETVMPEMSEEMVNELIEEIIEEMPIEEMPTEEPEVMEEEIIEEIIEEEIVTEEEQELEKIEVINEESEKTTEVETKFVNLDVESDIAEKKLDVLDLEVKI